MTFPSSLNLFLYYYITFSIFFLLYPHYFHCFSNLSMFISLSTLLVPWKWWLSSPTAGSVTDPPTAQLLCSDICCCICTMTTPCMGCSWLTAEGGSNTKAALFLEVMDLLWWSTMDQVFSHQTALQSRMFPSFLLSFTLSQTYTTIWWLFHSLPGSFPLFFPIVIAPKKSLPWIIPSGDSD